MAPKTKGKGKGAQFLLALLGHEGDDCVTWPMYRDPKGYGMLGYNGKLCYASRLMCTLAHGDPPSPLHEAAHSCGKGHEGCVNPNHLSWKTGTENQLDSVLHGTAGRKKGGPRRKLSAVQVEAIRTLEGKKTNQQIADLFDVAPETVAKIFRRETWTGETPNYNVRFSNEQRLSLRLRARKMRDQGITMRVIADTIGVSRVTVHNLLDELEQQSHDR